MELRMLVGQNVQFNCWIINFCWNAAVVVVAVVVVGDVTSAPHNHRDWLTLI